MPGVRAAVAEVDADVPVFDVTTFDDLYHGRALLPSRVCPDRLSAGRPLPDPGIDWTLCRDRVSIRATYAGDWRSDRGWRLARPRRSHGTETGPYFVVPGLAVGLALAGVFTPLLASPAFDFVTPGDPLVMTLAAVVMSTVAVVAATFPAVRASRVDPVTALRTQ